MHFIATLSFLVAPIPVIVEHHRTSSSRRPVAIAGRKARALSEGYSIVACFNVLQIEIPVLLKENTGIHAVASSHLTPASNYTIGKTRELQVETLATEIVGNGEVTYATAGVCGTEKISLAGEGSVNAGSVVCKNADVSILGTGEVVVQATERLSTTLLLTGSVKYGNGRPKSIQKSGLVLDSSVKPAEFIPTTEFTPASPPDRAATGVFLTVEAANNNDFPFIHARPTVQTNLRLQNLSASLPESMSALVLFEVAIVAMAFVAFSAFKFQLRRIRNKYKYETPAPGSGN